MSTLENIGKDALLHQKVKERIKLAKEKGVLGCSFCEAISGVHRIHLKKVIVKDNEGKTKKMYVCNFCVERMLKKHEKNVISAGRK